MVLSGQGTAVRASFILGDAASSRILAVMACRSLEELEQFLGKCNALNDLNQLLALAKGYGFDKWIECDTSVVQGLAYYTGAALMLPSDDQRLRNSYTTVLFTNAALACMNPEICFGMPACHTHHRCDFGKCVHTKAGPFENRLLWCRNGIRGV
jgi:hypothetical protein